MIYGELGRKQLEIIAKTRAVFFWARLGTTTVTTWHHYVQIII